MIYCLGDSHVSFFSGLDKIQPIWPSRSEDVLPWFRTFHLGPVLAYNLISEQSTTRGREKAWEVLHNVIPPGSRIMLCFGEIDCRAHLLLQLERQKKPLAEIVAVCVERYTRFAKEVSDAGFEVMLYNAIPSKRNKTDNRHHRNEYAAVGSCRMRNRTTRLFNGYLRGACQENSWLFLDTFDCFTLKDGLTTPWYFMDGIHLAQKAMPATLNHLSKLIPSLAIPPQIIPTSPSTWQRWKFYCNGRRERIGIELGKAIRLILTGSHYLR